MHKLVDYLCDELEELERKVENGGKLSMSEVQYGDMLAHFKKNLLKAEEMETGDYSYMMNDKVPYSYTSRRNGSRRYSRGNEDYRMNM